MGKKLKIVIIICVSVIVLWGMFFITDAVRISKNEKPIFSIKVASYDDGGSEKFMGLFYSVYHVKSLSVEEEEVIDHGFYLSTWFSSLRDIKDKL